jgi:hypothetical protein
LGIDDACGSDDAEFRRDELEEEEFDDDEFD